MDSLTVLEIVIQLTLVSTMRRKAGIVSTVAIDSFAASSLRRGAFRLRFRLPLPILSGGSMAIDPFNEPQESVFDRLARKVGEPIDILARGQAPRRVTGILDGKGADATLRLAASDPAHENDRIQVVKTSQVFTVTTVRTRYLNQEPAFLQLDLRPERSPMPSAATDPRNVFVIHGRNLAIRDSLFSFLSALHLNPIEWDNAIEMTGKATPYIGEILDAAFANARALVVLLTGDDEAQLREELRKPNDPPYESKLTAQPRANVLFEAGMAFGRNPEATILVQVGEVRQFSDILGRHVLRFRGTAEDRNRFSRRLQAAGCDVDTSGTRWLKEGAVWE